MRRLVARARSERGAAAVEFALVTPVLLVLLFGILGYGYMLSFRQAMSQAAAEGARAAGVAVSGIANTGPGDSRTTRAREAVDQALRSYGVTCSGSSLLHNGSNAGTCTITVGVSCTGSTTSATCARIALDYRYRDNPLLPSPGLGPVLPESLAYTTEVEITQ
jgi:Flp pilus assembly protein TadG